MEKKTLEIQFKDGSNKGFRISLNNPVDEIDKQNLVNLENAVVSNKLFAGPTGDLVKLESAVVREVKTTELIG